MEAFRRSLSFQKHRRSSSESQLVGSSEIDRESIETKPRSSLDTFVIPHRTRYPSNNIPPSTIDLHVAASLLSRTISEPSKTISTRSCYLLLILNRQSFLGLKDRSQAGLQTQLCRTLQRHRDTSWVDKYQLSRFSRFDGRLAQSYHPYTWKNNIKKNTLPTTVTEA